VYDIRVAWALGALDVSITNNLTETICENLETGALQSLGAHLETISPDQVVEGKYRLDDVNLLPPVRPRSFRDFYAFESHVKNARKKRGLEMQPEWSEQPVFYFSNTASIQGPGEEIRKPPDTNALDYELELAAVIGKEGRDVLVGEADSYIAGFTILNDWSARDLQMREMKVGLGPAKGKDFATSIGPYLVIPDELADRVLPPPELGEGSREEASRGNSYDLTMIARVNGKEYSRGNAKEMNWTFAELIAQASRNTTILPGDLIGSGTVGTGCILEIQDDDHPWLQAGDVVELEIEKLGILRNRVT
jgi:fumarylacetoacetate (FAA) hydrolase